MPLPQPSARRTRYLLNLEGGPCAGGFETVYASAMLRAVIDQFGKTDVLDAPGDQPEPGEAVHAYQADERRGRGHVLMRGPTRGLWIISYRYLGPFNVATGELDPLDQPISERLADEYRDREVAAFVATMRGENVRRAGATRGLRDPSPGQATLFPS